MFLRRRQVVLLISLLALGGSALEIAVSTRVSTDFSGQETLCRFDLCDESIPLAEAYRLQLEGAAGRAAGILLDSLARDPASAYRWLDLGQALAQAGSLDRASYCVARALRLGGSSADLLLGAADFYLRYGDRHEGLRLLARTLGMTPAYDDAVFSLFAARGIPVDQALAEGIPAVVHPAQAYLRTFLAGRDVTSAAKVWSWMSARHLIDQPIAVEYSRFLFNQRHFSEAAAAWAEVAGVLAPGYRTSEFVFDGSFAQEPAAGAVFDWRFERSDHAAIARECAADGCSLRVQFDGGANVAFHGVSQTVVLEPGAYRLRALVRGNGITTDQGVVLTVKDGEKAARLNVESEPMVGTFGWREVVLPFTVAAGADFVEVGVERHPSLRFDNRIAGTVWLRNVSIARVR